MSWMLTDSSKISFGLLCSPGFRWDKETFFFFFILLRKRWRSKDWGTVNLEGE